MTQGERRLAERLEQKLDDDYLVWYDVPVGPKHSHPDFVVLHPRRGLLILEIKDWQLETIRQRQQAERGRSFPTAQPKIVINPLEQARHYAHPGGGCAGARRAAGPCAGAAPGQARLPLELWRGVHPHHAQAVRGRRPRRCHRAAPRHLPRRDAERVDAEALPAAGCGTCSRTLCGGVLSLPQLDRVRWIMFPEVRVQTQVGLFDDRRCRGANCPTSCA